MVRGRISAGTGKQRRGGQTGIARTPIKRMGEAMWASALRETVEEQDVPGSVVGPAVEGIPAIENTTDTMDAETRLMDMRLRSRIQLLAPTAALLGLCVTVGGCQTSPLCRDCSTPTCSTCSTPGMASANGSVFTDKIRPLFLRRSATPEPVLAGSSGSNGCQAAGLLRPVPMSTASGSEPGPILVQPTSGESTGSGDVRPAVTMDRPFTMPV